MNSIDDPKNWLPLKEAAHALRVSRHTVVRLCEERDPLTRKPYLHGWRASPGTLLISRASLQDYCNMTRGDLDFWAERKRRLTTPVSLPRRASRPKTPPVGHACPRRGRP